MMYITHLCAFRLAYKVDLLRTAKSECDIQIAVRRCDGAHLLVARSHECDYPEKIVESLPSITGAANGQFTTSREVHDATCQAVQDGRSIYSVNVETLKAVRPTVCITQDVCDVCAVSLGCVDAAVHAAKLEPPPTVVTLGAYSLDGILKDMEKVGDALGLQASAAEAVAALRARVAAAQQTAAEMGPAKHPKVAFLEWTDPLFNGGHWTPGLIAMAGGTHPLNPHDPATMSAGPSVTITPEQLADADPDIIILCPCGLDLEIGSIEAAQLTRRDWWRGLRAVADGRVFLVDGNQFFNRPGPRLVDALEWLVAVLHDRWELMPQGFAWKLLPSTPPAATTVATAAARGGSSSSTTQQGAAAGSCACAADGHGACGEGGEEEGGEEEGPRTAALAGCCVPQLPTDLEDLYCEAVQAGRDHYRDPVSGYSVFTEQALRTRETCCGNRCRHCPFGHFRVTRRGPRINRITRPAFMIWGASFALPPATLLLVADARHVSPPPSAVAAVAGAAAGTAVATGAAAAGAGTAPGATGGAAGGALEAAVAAARERGYESVTVVIGVDPASRAIWIGPGTTGGAGDADVSTAAATAAAAASGDALTWLQDKCLSAKVNIAAVPIPARLPRGDDGWVRQGGVCGWVLARAVKVLPAGMAAQGVAWVGDGSLPCVPWAGKHAEPAAGRWEEVVGVLGLEGCTPVKLQ